MTKPPSASNASESAPRGADSPDGATAAPQSSTSVASNDVSSNRKAGRRPTPIRDRARVGGIVREQRSPKAVAASVLLHIAVAFVMLQILTFGHGLSSFLTFGTNEAQLEERLTYVATTPKPPVPEPVVTTRPRTPQTTVTPTAPVAAPTDVPSGGAPPAAPARVDTGSGVGASGTGNGVGAIDPDLRGVKPSLTDPRVWPGRAGDGPERRVGRNGTDRLDSVMGYAITSARDSLDSLARAQGKYDRAPGDWTKTGKDGDKWGWDQKGIRLGKVTIPNALLALLPMNAASASLMSGNYTSSQREARLALSTADIQRMSQQRMGDADFKKLANELRDRRERERRDRLRAPSASVAPAAPAGPPIKNEKK